MKFFKNNQRIKPKPLVPREYEVIEKEYVQECASLGQLLARRDELDAQVKEKSRLVQALNLEGNERKRLNAEKEQSNGQSA